MTFPRVLPRRGEELEASPAHKAGRPVGEGAPQRRGGSTALDAARRYIAAHPDGPRAVIARQKPAA